ncbi:hypothetical protein QAD02_004601 [Eretmocerus hayati]|uniref:Uncharacterized protein n=1 Tax=Eretmocerus hayati TaxID=131215 RepID=A0ACC2NSR7_9HYME|nr:hypothetical protein QAD02_004601 [Eretmocerus hayati]
MEDSLEDEFTPESVENYKSRFPVSPKIDSEPETLLDDSQPSSSHLSGSRINLDEPCRDVEGSHSHNDVPVYQSQSIILSDNVTDQSHSKLTPIGNDHHFSSCSKYGNSPQIQNFPREFESHNSIRHVSGHCESHKENTSNPPTPSCLANSQYCLENAGCRGGLLQDSHGTHVFPPCINIHNSSDVSTPKHQEPVQRDDTDLILPVKRGILQLKTRGSSGQAKEKTCNTVGLPGKANTHPKVNSNCSDESLDEHSQFVTSTVPSTSILRNQDPKQHQAYVDNLKLSDATDYQKHQETVQPNENSPGVGTPKHQTPVRRDDTQLILPAKRGRLQLKTIGSSGQAKEQSRNAVKLHGKDIAPPKFHSGCSEESPDQAFKSFSPSVPSTSILHNHDTKQHQAFVHNLKLLDFRAQKAQETVQFNDTNLHSAAQRGTPQLRARGSRIQPNETSNHTVTSLGKSDAHSQMVSPIKITEENFKCLSPSVSSTLIIHTQDAKLCQQNACNNTLPDPHASKRPTSVQANDAHLPVKQGSSQLQTRGSTVQANELSPNTVGLVGLLCKSYADSYIDPICSSKTADDSIKLSSPSVPVTFLSQTQNTEHQQPHSNSLPIVSSAMRVPKSASLPTKENRKSHTNYNNSHSTGLAQSTESTHCDTSNLTVCVDSSNVEVHPPHCFTGMKTSEVIGKSLEDKFASTAVSSGPTGRLLLDPDLEVDDGSTNIQTANCSIAQQAGHSNEEREFSEEGIKSYNDSVSEDLAKEQRKLTFCPEVAIGKEFYSDAEIKAYIADIKRTTGENFSIRDSKKKENRVKTHSRLHANPNLTFDLIIYVCIHGEITKESQSTNARQAL